MLGWRRRKDGFEWREYVRTTILVRRKNRRDRIVRAGHAAVDGLKVARERGAVAGAMGAQAVGRAAKVVGQQGMSVGGAGASALGRGAKVAGQHGLEMGAAGLRAADDRIRASVPVVWEGLQAFGRNVLAVLGIVWAILSAAAVRLAEILAPFIAAGWERLQPFLAWLRKPGVAAVLALVAGVAFVGSFRRIAANGFSGDIFIALLIGVIIAGALLAAWLANGVPRWLAAPLGALRHYGPSPATLTRSGALVAMLAVIIGAVWLVWRAGAALPSHMTDASPVIEGRAVALSGDTLRVGKTTIVLSGIEAPVEGQTCLSDRSRPWRCDTAAKSALARLLRLGAVRCALSGSNDRGQNVGACRSGETDIAAELVRNGNVFAETGFFSSYGGLESKAREAKAGIWHGEVVRPSEYRSQKWEAAKRESPEGCPIKGNVSRGQRIYVLPWARNYKRVKISSRRGERWFCSEEEALVAGWKPSGQS